jgi:hypothetical protein
MHGDCGIDQIAAQRAQSRQSAIFVGAREPAVADHIRDWNRCKFGISDTRALTRHAE